MFDIPDRVPLEDQAVVLELTDPSRSAELFQATWADGEELFYHMFFGPFSSAEEMEAHMKQEQNNRDKISYTVFSKRLNRTVGSLALSSLNRTHGTAEIGSVWYAKEAQGSEINTHAVYLLLAMLFEDYRYRRVVWKCDRTNESSRAAALALGFRFEGVFRNHFIIKGRSRDTSWFSMILEEWPEKKNLLQSRIKDKDRLFF